MPALLARFSARRPLLVIAVWLVLVVVSLAVVRAFLPTATTTDLRLAGRYESERAAALLDDRLRGPEKLAEIVLIQSPSLTVQDDAFRSKVESVHFEIIDLGKSIISGGIDDSPLSHYYQVIDAGPLIPQEQVQQLLPLLVSADQGTVMMHYTMAGLSQEATANVAEVIEVVEEANRDDDFLVLIGGDASVAYENNELAEHDLQQGERFRRSCGPPCSLGPLWRRRCHRAPLGLAVVSIAVALAAVALIGQQFQLLFFVTIMVVMLGLAVGIDYSLLIVLRFKEELGRGHSPREAVARTGDTAGRTVVFSGVTVVLALVGLLIVPASFYQSLALGAILVVLATPGGYPHAPSRRARRPGSPDRLPCHPFSLQVLLKGADTSEGDSGTSLPASLPSAQSSACSLWACR